jgi:hypothetical protein
LQGRDGLATRAAKKLKNEEHLFVQMGATRLRHEMDRIPLWRGNHVSIKQLAEDMAKYLYLPRLRDEDVLLAAIRDGLASLTWQSETFAYADGWDEARGRYIALKAGQSIRVLTDAKCLLVKPDVANAQMQADAQKQRELEKAAGADQAKADQTDTDGGDGHRDGSTDDSKQKRSGVTPPPAPEYRRFHASVTIDANRVGRDVAQIAEEVVQHLTKLDGAVVNVTMEIQAEFPDGVSEKTVRDVTENCRTLRFNSFGFEEE